MVGALELAGRGISRENSRRIATQGWREGRDEGGSEVFGTSNPESIDGVVV